MKQSFPKFRWHNEAIFSQSFPISQILPSDQTIGLPMKICDHSATQKTSDQTIVRPKSLWSDYRATQTFRATLLRPKILCNFSATNASSDQTIPKYML